MRHNYTDITLRFLQPNKIICREGRVNLQSIPQLLAGFNSQQLRVYLKLHNIYLELTLQIHETMTTKRVTRVTTAATATTIRAVAAGTRKQ